VDFRRWDVEVEALRKRAKVIRQVGHLRGEGATGEKREKGPKVGCAVTTWCVCCEMVVMDRVWRGGGGGKAVEGERG
jgi:hypothetical protein